MEEFFNRLVYSANFALLDFSHLSQTEWDAQRPIRSKSGHLKVAPHPAFRCRPRSSQQCSERGYSETSSPICRVG